MSDIVELTGKHGCTIHRWMHEDPFENEPMKQTPDKNLLAAREIVESSSDTFAGTPVIRGTRIPVYDVAACVRARGAVAARPGSYRHACNSRHAT
jgi:hypothetical protein